jgi:hypothetical protein
MPKKAGKLTIYQEESKMTATLTLNDLTIEQASAVLTLLDEMKNCTITPEEARNGVELFPAPAPAPAPAPVQTAAIPTTTPAPVQTAAIPAAAPAPRPAQTAPQTYTVQQLGQAARPLMENGRQQELIGLLAEFGVQSVAALPENRRADFAARLRAMGGLI